MRTTCGIGLKSVIARPPPLVVSKPVDVEDVVRRPAEEWGEPELGDALRHMLEGLQKKPLRLLRWKHKSWKWISSVPPSLWTLRAKSRRVGLYQNPCFLPRFGPLQPPNMVICCIDANLFG